MSEMADLEDLDQYTAEEMALARKIADINYANRPKAGLPILASEAAYLARELIAAGWVKSPGASQ